MSDETRREMYVKTMMTLCKLVKKYDGKKAYAIAAAAKAAK